MVVRLGEAAKIPFPVHPHIAAPTLRRSHTTLTRSPPKETSITVPRSV
jgi:hypothetical protein